MDLFEAVRSRASVRKLRPVEVPDADLEQILDAGHRAPSGRNKQPTEYIVVRDPETLKKLARAQGFIADVEVAIAVVTDPNKSQYWLEDAAAATENMLLAVTALGYASVWVEGTLLPKLEEHNKALGLPDKMRLVVVLPIGAATKPTEQAKKRPLSKLLHWERYGQRNR